MKVTSCGLSFGGGMMKCNGMKTHKRSGINHWNNFYIVPGIECLPQAVWSIVGDHSIILRNNIIVSIEWKP